MGTASKPCLKLKANLMSNDGGRSFTVTRQYYLTDLNSGRLLDESFEGLFLTQPEENANGKHINDDQV
jgi:hypothetical protein